MPASSDFKRHKGVSGGKSPTSALERPVWLASWVLFLETFYAVLGHFSLIFNKKTSPLD